MKDFAVFSCTYAKYVVPLYVFIEMNMQKHIFSFFALLFIAQMVWADSIASSVSLSSYYATVNNKSNNELRLALFDVIKGHTQIGYKQLGVIMQYSDTENADGKNVVDIYTNCTYTCNGALSWISSGDVGAGMNREHTVPQSWFNENEPMKSDAFHVYPTDSKANNNRSSFLFGEFSGAGTSYSTSKCSETGKKGSSEWTAGTTSYTYNNQTYVAATTYTGTVYEPADEYKGDLARSYFYMATRYADICANWAGGFHYGYFIQLAAAKRLSLLRGAVRQSPWLPQHQGHQRLSGSVRREPAAEVPSGRAQQRDHLEGAHGGL